MKKYSKAEIFSLACNGNIQELEKISYNQDIDIVLNCFNKSHSIFIGAWRNRQFETCKFLLKIGALPLNNELIEICEDFERLYKSHN